MQEHIEKKKMSAGAKWGIGCGSGCLVIIIGLIVAGFFGYFFAKGKLDEVTAELEEVGFDKTIKGQVMEVREEVTEPVMYLGQMVKIMAPVKSDLAIVAQMAEIHAPVEGKLYFRGQMLIVQPSGVLMQGLDAKAQIIQNFGKIEGEITGTYQMVDSGAGMPAQE